MKRISKKIIVKLITFQLFILCTVGLSAQTDIDGLMMGKNAFCVGPIYSYSSWKNYWEGTLKRENLNLGRVSTQMLGVMGNFGLTRKINLLFSAPYVKTKASAGTLHGLEGIQDLSLFVKWRPFQKKMRAGMLSLFAIGGLLFPLSNYTPDFLPLSIGLHSTTLSARVMADYQQGNLFATGSATYVYRNNIKIDREAYYTSQMYYTHEVEMPDGINFNFRAGFRNHRLIAEAVANNWTSLGGFDITRNNMPFPSNRMNATTVGANFKYVISSIPKLSIVAGGNATIAGRNMGQAVTIYGSFFYVIDLGRKTKSTDQPEKTK